MQQIGILIFKFDENVKNIFIKDFFYDNKCMSFYYFITLTIQFLIMLNKII